jgi:hypothetical protein
MKVKCTYCKAEVEKRPTDVKRYKTHFCNRECANNHRKSKKVLKEVVCDCCGKTIHKTRNQLRNSKTGRYYCDNTCKNKHVAQLRWKDVDNTKSHRSRSKTVKENANNACQCCGYNEDKRMLDVHHKDGNHQNNTWENLCCICVWCHNLHHRCGAELDIK